MIQMDVTDESSVKKGIDYIIARESRIDVVVNNAGSAIIGSLEDTTIEEAKSQLETNFFGISRVNLGWTYCLLGKLETARQHMEKGLKIQLDEGAHFHLCYFYRQLSLVHLESGDLKNAQQRAEEALKSSQRDHEKWDEGLIWILLGRIYGKAEKTPVERAEECILQGIKILEELKLKPHYAPGFHYLAELYADTGQRDKALVNLKTAEGLFREMGMDYWLNKTQAVVEKFQT